MMKITMHLFVWFIAVAVGATKLDAQSLPSGSVGIVYTYDAAGDRINREYIVNNTSSAIADVVRADTLAKSNKYNDQVLKVNALYPNPTTGQITIKLIKPVQNATLHIIDVAGHIVLNARASGSVIKCDLSRFVAGIYFLNIEQGEQKVSMKIIKR